MLARSCLMVPWYWATSAACARHMRLLTWNYTLLQQFLVTHKIHLRVVQQSLIVCQSSRPRSS